MKQGLARIFLFEKLSEISFYFRKEIERNIFFTAGRNEKEMRNFSTFLRKKETERNEKFLYISFSVMFYLFYLFPTYDLHTNPLVTCLWRVPCFSSKVFKILVFRRNSNNYFLSEVICFLFKPFLTKSFDQRQIS